MTWGLARRIGVACLPLAITVSGFCQAPTPSLVDQFGTAGADIFNASAANSSGLFVVGTSGGDVVVRKYALANQQLLQTLTFGTLSAEQGLGIAADESGVYVVGATGGDLNGTSSGFQDAFIRKYSNDLSQPAVWGRQFGTTGVTPGGTVARSVSVDAAGVSVVGYTDGVLQGQSSAGGRDAFIVRFALNPASSDGPLWTSQFGGTPGQFQSVSLDEANAVLSDAGNIYVVGRTNGVLAGTSLFGNNVFVRTFSSSGSVLGTFQDGSDGNDVVSGAVLSVEGGVPYIYVAGQTNGAYAGASSGSDDAVLVKYNLAGTQVWAKKIDAGSGIADDFKSVSVDSTGVYAAGVTGGVITPPTGGGANDVIVVKWDLAGTEQWRLQFGSSGADEARTILAHASGVYVVGSTAGSLLSGAAQGSTDAFLVRFAESTSGGASISGLITLVKSYNLKSGIENSLDAKLTAAAKAYDAAVSGDRYTACNQLAAFINAVNAQTGKSITPAQASALIAMVQQIQSGIGCTL